VSTIPLRKTMPLLALPSEFRNKEIRFTNSNHRVSRALANAAIRRERVREAFSNPTKSHRPSS
jgi:hypothetical protein